MDDWSGATCRDTAIVCDHLCQSVAAVLGLYNDTVPRALYFAYGSNLDLRRFRRRCPGATVAGRARLAEHALAFTRYSRAEKGGVADIVPQPGATVWGALYEIDEGCFRALDEYEGAPREYRRETVVVIDDAGVEREAVAYVGNKTGEFAPSRQYLAQITRGAREHELPEEYVRTLESVRTHA
jgi:gamma-glutamylcyclotransferase